MHPSYPLQTRVESRGLMRDAYQLARAQEHRGLEWSGPPERKTLRPYCECIVLLEPACEWGVCVCALLGLA
jgi:hypothetical protein